jgi:hypothetical protein
MVSWTGWRGGIRWPSWKASTTTRTARPVGRGIAASRGSGDDCYGLGRPWRLVGAICWPPAAATIAVVSHAVLARLQAR